MTGAVAGTRGGLGRILLTAFMLLAIVPLGVVSFLAVEWAQEDMRQAAIDRLALVATLRQGQLQSWLNAQRYGLTLLAHDSAFREAVRREQWGDACRVLQGRHLGDASQMALSFWPAEGRVALCTLGNAAWVDVSQALSLKVPVNDDGGRPLAILAGYPGPQALSQVLYATEVGDDQRVRLVERRNGSTLLWSSESERWSESPLYSWVVDEQGSGFYNDLFGDPMIGAYRQLPGRQVALLVEQSVETALAREDDLAAMLVGSTLAVALLTAVLAAVITRQLTRPIVRLTMSAIKIARGDLSQTVRVDRRDEIGILARVFNIMTSELRSLYVDLERKVAERTGQLTEANRQLRYQAMQLRLNADVGRVVTSILDLDLLLRRVTQLILESYAPVYSVEYVAVLLRDELGEWVELQAQSGSEGECGVSLVALGDDSLIGQTAADGQLRVHECVGDAIEVVVPLRIVSRVIGVLDFRCSRQDVLRMNDLEVLQGLGDQISVAIENARIYAIERGTVERLSRLDHMRLASLGVGSRELATELNTIIGFSRLILKGADGPLTDLQCSDLAAIYKSGYKLLGLIDNVITLSELEGGLVKLDRQSIGLTPLFSEVLAMAKQRLVDVTVVWHGGEALPPLQGDLSLLRQAFLGLVTAVAEQVTRDSVAVWAYESEAHPDRVFVSIGNGRCGLWELAESSASASKLSEDVEEMSVSLALARQVILLHGGEMRLQFDAEQGLTSVVMLPIAVEDQA